MEVYVNQPNDEALNTNEELNATQLEERNFVMLFDEVLEAMKGELSEIEIESGVKEIIKIFPGKISGSCIDKNLNTPERRCGFFYRYSPLFAGITRARFLTAFRYCEKLRSCFKRSHLKIVDIGSGAGSSLVGLFSALQSYKETSTVNLVGFSFLSLEVIAVDYIRNWKPFFLCIKKKLEEGNFGNASILFKEKDVKCSFLPYNVLGNLDDAKLKDADIILMKGFLTVLESNDQRVQVSKAVSSVMKPGSLLVIIESPTYEKYFQQKQNLRLIFTTRKYISTSQDSELTSQAEISNSQDQSLRSVSQAHDSVLQASRLESDYVWEAYDENKRCDLNDKYDFKAPAERKYDRGIAMDSNQQIFVLEKVQ